MQSIGRQGDRYTWGETCFGTQWADIKIKSLYSNICSKDVSALRPDRKFRHPRTACNGLKKCEVFSILCLQADLSDKKAIEEVAQHVESKIDILVNNSGLVDNSSPLEGRHPAATVQSPCRS